MSSFQLSREILEARDVACDRESVAQRLERYRDVFPSDQPALLVGNGTDAAPRSPTTAR